MWPPACAPGIFFSRLMHPIGPELPNSAHVACAHVRRQLYVLCASHALVQATVGVGTGGGGTLKQTVCSRAPKKRPRRTPTAIATHLDNGGCRTVAGVGSICARWLPRPALTLQVQPVATVGLQAAHRLLWGHAPSSARPWPRGVGWAPHASDRHRRETGRWQDRITRFGWRGRGATSGAGASRAFLLSSCVPSFDLSFFFCSALKMSFRESCSAQGLRAASSKKKTFMRYQGRNLNDGDVHNHFLRALGNNDH